MKSDVEITDLLDQIGRDWPKGASVENAVLERLDDMGWDSDATRPHGWTRLLSRRQLAVAALLIVSLLVAVLWGGGRSQTLYAQVQQTLARAKSVHVAIQVIVDGKLKQAGDMWYLRDVGFRSQLGGEVRIDDGRHVWRYVEGEPTAFRSDGSGENARIWDDMLGLRTQLDRDFVRAPERDRMFENVPTECFVPNDELEKRVAPMPDGRRARPVLWVAPNFELRRVEIEARDGNEWQPTSVQDWQYDVEVDASLFRPDFGTDVKIVDADQQFDEFLSLDKAVYQETRNGLIYAIHRIERFAGGGLALLTSVRGTEETLVKFPLRRRRLGPGRIFVEPPATNYNASPQGSGYFRIPLATASNNGIDAQWWIVIPRDTPATFFDVGPGKVKVRAAMTPSGSYAKLFVDSRGVSQIVYWDVKLEVPTPTPQPNLSSISEHVYRDVRKLDAVSVRQLDLGIEKDRFVAKFGSPEDVTAEEFAAAVADHVLYWQQRDVEFQRKQSDGGQLDVDLENGENE